MSTQNTNINETVVKNLNAVEKDNGNIVIGVKGNEKFFHLAMNKKDKYFKNPDDFVRFVKNTEGAVRRSVEYSRYIAYLKNDVGLRSCALFKDINDSVAPIEFHHYIFNLYDIIEMQISHLFKAGEPINSMNVANHVLKDHFKNIIQIVPLCEMAHKGWHAFQKIKSKENSKFFISMDSCFGDITKFIETYHNDMTMQHVMKLKKYLTDYELYCTNKTSPEMFKATVTKWSEIFDDGGSE